MFHKSKHFIQRNFMKYIYLFLAFILVISCKTQQKLTQNVPSQFQNINCPEEGDCVFEVLKNSNLQIKTDEFGKLYPEITSGDKLVIKYHFKKDSNKDIADSNYSEYVYFEIDKNEKQIILKDAALQNVKMIFGRICFCRDAMGYFKVTEGNLFLFNTNGTIQLKTKFKVNKVPQIITEINENIKY